jgi:hypothetical protein
VSRWFPLIACRATCRFEHPQNTVLGQVVTANLELEALAAEPAYSVAADGSGAGGQASPIPRIYSSQPQLLLLADGALEEACS